MNKYQYLCVSFMSLASLLGLNSHVQAQWYTPIPAPDTYIMPTAIDNEICRQNPEVRNHPRCQNPGSLGTGERTNPNDSQQSPNSNALSYVQQGARKLEQKNYRIALKNFNEAIEIRPNYALAYYGRGVTYYKLGKKNQAFSDLQFAATLAKQQDNDRLYQRIQNSIRQMRW